jgi:hypothetical protein
VQSDVRVRCVRTFACTNTQGCTKCVAFVGPSVAIILCELKAHRGVNDVDTRRRDTKCEAAGNKTVRFVNKT